MGDAALVHTHNLFFLSKIRKISIFFTHVFPVAKKKKWPHLFFGEKKKKKKKPACLICFFQKVPEKQLYFFFWPNLQKLIESVKLSGKGLMTRNVMY